MLLFASKAILQLLVLLGFAAASKGALANDLLSAPTTLWSQQLFGAAGGNAQVPSGNGLFLTPDGSEVLAIAEDGKVASYAAADGEPLWDQIPSETVAGASGIAFTTEAASTGFLVYALTYRNETGTGTDHTVVVKLGMAGELLFVSQALEGKHSGTPVVSDDGEHVFLTHNSQDMSTGYFTILDASLDVVVTRFEESVAFGPPGIYHSPDEGFYDAIPGIADGTFNSNDIVMWSLTPQTPNAPVPAGRIFAFQFAVGVDVAADADTLDYFVLGANRAFQAITPPVITNKGRTAYFSASRSEFFCFIGNPGVNRARFNRNPNLKLAFQKNSLWSGQPIFAPPAVVTDEEVGSTVVFGGSASNEFFRFENYFNGTFGDASKVIVSPDPITVVTSNLIVASPVVDPSERVVYYVERNGVLHQANYTDIADVWTETIADGVQGAMAISRDGSVLYVMSVDGRISALTVAADEATGAPTRAPVTPAPTTEVDAGTPALTSAPAAPDSPPTEASGSPVADPPTKAPDVADPPTKAPDTSPDDQESSAVARSIQLAAASLAWMFLLL